MMNSDYRSRKSRRRSEIGLPALLGTGRYDSSQRASQAMARSFVIHALTDLVRKLLGLPGAAMVYAPTGVAAFQVGGPTGQILPQRPNGKKAFGQIEPSKGASMRKVQGNLSRCARLSGDERGMIGRSMLGRQEYNAALAPIAREARSSESWGGRHVVNFRGDDIQLPPALGDPRYDRSGRGPSAHRGIAVHDGFEGAVAIREIARRVGRRRGDPRRTHESPDIQPYCRGRGLSDVLPAGQSPEGIQK